MPVVEEYVTVGETGRPFVERTRIPAPRGTSLGQMSALDLWNEIAESLRLPFVGTFTMWALREGDMQWQPVPSQPDTNYMVWQINDRAVARATELSFGNPLPYVVVLSDRLLPMTEAQRIWEGSAYQAYQTEAVYSQDDAREPPRMRFMYWGERRDMPDVPQRAKALEAVAADAGGVLTFAAQVAEEGTTKRQFPALHFQDALSMQMTPIEPPPPEMTDPSAPAVPQQEARTGRGSLVMPVLLGVGAGVAAFAAVRAMRED